MAPKETNLGHEDTAGHDPKLTNCSRVLGTHKDLSLHVLSVLLPSPKITESCRLGTAQNTTVSSSV